MGAAAVIAAYEQTNKSKSSGDYKPSWKFYFWFFIVCLFGGGLFMWGLLAIAIWMEKFY